MKKLFLSLALSASMTTLLSFSSPTENTNEEERPTMKTYIIYEKNDQVHFVIVNGELDCAALEAGNSFGHNNGVTITDCWHEF